MLIIVALGGMVSSHAFETCVTPPPGYGVCVLLNEPGVYSGANATGVMTYTGPTAGGQVLVECSYTNNDRLHANFYVAGRWVAWNPEMDRQICS